MIHRVVERLYCEHYEWEGSKSDIKYVFAVTLTQWFSQYPGLSKVLEDPEMSTA